MKTLLTEIFKDDITKMWSLSRISAAIVLVFNLFYAVYSVYKTNTLGDLGNNWLLLILTLYGINKGATALTNIKIGSAELSTAQADKK